MENQHLDDLLPGFALGSLDPEEHREVLRHLAGCQRCQSELLAYQEVVEHLPLAVQDSNPPSGLRGAVLEKAGLGTTGRPDRAGAPWFAGITAFFHKNALSWGLSSLALIIVLGTATLLLWGQLQTRVRPQAMQIFVLQPTARNPEAEAVLVLDGEGVEGNLTVDGLPELPENLQYQLWLIAGENRKDAGVFSVNEAGYGKLHIEVPEGLAAYTGLGVTIEPAGGSPGPTGDKVLGVDL